MRPSLRINSRLCAALAVLCSLFASSAAAQTGSWRAYMSYFEPQQIVKAGDNTLFVRASNDLYSYNLNDKSITTYDKVTSLSDTYITHIAWNATAQRLVIVYQDSNIDLMSLSGSVTNISALYSKSMTQDKTVNAIYVSEQYAYLATNFGVVKVNVQRAEIAESYILDQKVSVVGISGDRIYIRNTSGQVLSALLTDNLIDPHNWSTPGSVPSGVFTADNSDWTENIELVRTLEPGGPKVNYFGFMTFHDGRLYTSTGGTRAGNIQVKSGLDDWQIYQSTGFSATTGLTSYANILALAIDPNDPDHVFASSRNGLYEFQNGEFAAHYDRRNSPIEWYKLDRPEYQLVTSVVCDGNGYVWCANSQSMNCPIMKMSLATHEWTANAPKELMRFVRDGNNQGLAYMVGMMVDSQGYIWFVNDNYTLDSFYCIDPNTLEVVNYYDAFQNQDGITIDDYRPHCIAEDLEGNIWIGTKVGPFVLDRANLYTKDAALTQVKVPRNDGSNYADYLLSGVNVSCMAIDGGGRKWFGTNGSGVYLISADNMTQIEYFTTENSPLLSNNIESIAINNETGEVFFGTDCGLCSYMSDATTAAVEMVNDDVYAYPNPVAPGYDGLITIVGLSMNADVKILSTSGQLVAQGRSNGGTFTWNGRDRQGRRVASGVYMVAAATSDGKKGTVCKIAVVN